MTENSATRAEQEVRKIKFASLTQENSRMEEPFLAFHALERDATVDCQMHHEDGIKGYTFVMMMTLCIALSVGFSLRSDSE